MPRFSEDSLYNCHIVIFYYCGELICCLCIILKWDKTERRLTLLSGLLYMG